MELTGNDLVNVLRIIDICSQRGCLKGPELKGVGEIYEKISNLVKELSSKNQQQNNVDKNIETQEEEVKTI